MKGTLVKCFANMIKDNYGEAKWDEILQRSGESPGMVIKALSDVDDGMVFKLVENTCKILKLSQQQVWDKFGDHWVNVYTPRVYTAYFTNFKTAKQFILQMDKIHVNVTHDIANAHPPRFTFEEVDENTIIVNYMSARHMIDYYVGLVKGVSRYFNTPIGIKTLPDDRIELTFG